MSMESYSSKIKKQMIIICLTVFSLIMVSTTLLFIFENPARKILIDDQKILCDKIENYQHKEILTYIYTKSNHYKSLSTNRNSNKQESFIFDHEECVNKYNMV